jgi:hypothetical protein
VLPATVIRPKFTPSQVARINAQNESPARHLCSSATSRAHHTWIARNSFETFRGPAINALAAFSNDARSAQKVWEVNMLKKLLGAAAMAAVAFAVVPASAAKMAGCSGENLEKTESATETMADGAGKIAAQKEVAQAQEALLGGKTGACAMHLSRAMHAGTMNQAPHGGTMNQAPAETTTQAPYQSQGQWKPIQKAL